jgi:steroid delta-isomerase-like uncharacterized protein
MDRTTLHVSAAAGVLALLVTGAVVSAPSQAATPRQSTLTSVSAGAAVEAAATTSSNHAARVQAKALAERFYVPFRTGRVNLLDTVLSKNWIDQPLTQGQQPGREGFKPVIAGYRTVFPDLKVTHQVFIVSANAQTVTVRSVFSGTQRAEFLGVPATGKKITFRTTDVHRIHSGRIVETWHLEDLFGAYQQLLAAQKSTTH